MKFRTTKPSCEEARAIDMVSYLAAIGHDPVKIRGNNYWYLSPLRNEKTASFKINRSLNRWKDFGDGAGGNLIDFGVLYYRCTVADFLAMLENDMPVFNPGQSVANTTGNLVSEPKIEVLKTCDLRSPELLLYLHERKIPVQICSQYCHEITYAFNGHSYYAIGFRNDLGGYELRNRYFKGSSSPKGITTIKNNATGLSVFEGFIDFLSFLVLTPATSEQPQDFMILNSTAFFENTLPLMQEYEQVNLYLDNDPTGQNCSQMAMALDSRFIDQSRSYKGHNDLNNFLTGKNST